jgi:hypothetical protein
MKNLLLRWMLLAVGMAMCVVGAMAARGTPAHGEVAELRVPMGTVYLFDESRTCPDGTQLALWRPTEGAPVPGCWFERLGVAWVAWADGDYVGYAPERFARRMRHPS